MYSAVKFLVNRVCQQILQKSLLMRFQYQITERCIYYYFRVLYEKVERGLKGEDLREFMGRKNNYKLRRVLEFVSNIQEKLK